MHAPGVVQVGVEHDHTEAEDVHRVLVLKTGLRVGSVEHTRELLKDSVNLLCFSRQPELPQQPTQRFIQSTVSEVVPTGEGEG